MKPAAPREAILVGSLMMVETLVDPEPVPMSIPASPCAWEPFSPRLLASTVEFDRSTLEAPF